VNPVRCSFYVRVPEGDGFRYDPVEADAPNGVLPTPYPPSPGDLIFIHGGVYEVIVRQWLHASWGSYDWPHVQAEPQDGPMMDIIVTPAEGVFRDEVSPPDDD
jgi:hypothetical protein